MPVPTFIPEITPAPVVESQKQPFVAEEGYIYIHCHLGPLPEELLIRIWKTTYLFDKGSAARASLVHAENISTAPVWTAIPAKRAYSFLLIFEGLPKTCLAFDMIEKIPQPGGFAVPDIQRNTTDVYHLTLL